MVTVRLFLRRHLVGTMVGAILAGIVILPVAGLLAMTLGGNLGAGWGDAVAGRPGALLGLILGYALVFVLLEGIACAAGGVLGSTVHWLIRRLFWSRSEQGIP